MTSTNTTIYGLDDRYRGVKGGLRVLFINPDDVGALGFVDGDRVDLISEWGEPDGTVQERWAKDFRLVPYPTPRGNVASYYLSGDQSVDPPQSRCSHIEHAGLESRHDSSRAA
jgi:anaerobic selenocysteine-containing dehydrogenase